MSIRTSEATSYTRMSAFNENTVSTFFDKLQELRLRHAFPVSCIYNLDETGVSLLMKYTTHCYKECKIII